MKKIHCLFMMIMTLVFASCTNEDPCIPAGLKENTTTNPNRISVGEAIQIANKMMGDISDVKTRSNRQVGEISIIKGNVSTRASQETSDTILYVINYTNDEGFAVVAADKRAIPIYALSDSGHFQIDEKSNPAIETMLSYAIESVKFHAQTQEIGSNPFIPGGFPPLDSIVWHDVPPYKKIAPMISKRQNRIGPSAELSKYVVNDNGDPALTSCVPIAAELIMSYHKWPKKILSESFNWDAMNSGIDDDGIARLLGIISGKDYIHVTGNTMTDGGRANYVNIIPTLEKCGYERPDKFIYFYGNEENAISSLDKGPILVRGGSGVPEWNTGHIWVIDGLLQYYIGDGTTIPSESGTPVPVLKLYTYYHCVWGDSGSCNGYYLVADHDFNGAPDKFDAIDSGDVSGAKYRQYSKSIVFLGNFKPLNGLTLPSVPYQP